MSFTTWSNLFTGLIVLCLCMVIILILIPNFLTFVLTELVMVSLIAVAIVGKATTLNISDDDQ